MTVQSETTDAEVAVQPRTAADAAVLDRSAADAVGPEFNSPCRRVRWRVIDQHLIRSRGVS